MLSLIIKELEANEISTLESLWCILTCIEKRHQGLMPAQFCLAWGFSVAI